MRKTQVRAPRRWWLHPSLLATIFVLISVILAISASLDQRPARDSGNRYWQTFIQRPALAQEDSVIIGTWRRDVRLNSESSASLHCGLRTYGLTTKGEDHFLKSIANGLAEGWAAADPDDPLPDLIRRRTPCLQAPDTFMSKILDNISTAWDNPQNPRYLRRTPTGSMTMHGVFDERSGQVFVWFMEQSD